MKSQSQAVRVLSFASTRTVVSSVSTIFHLGDEAQEPLVEGLDDLGGAVEQVAQRRVVRMHPGTPVGLRLAVQRE
jgi:hypothetical protein